MTHRFSKSRISFALCSAAIFSTSAFAAGSHLYTNPDDEIKFESAVASNAFINIEDGPIVVTPIKEEAWSSRWYLEPVGVDNFVRLKNRWKGCYLNIEQGPLECGAKDNGDNTGGRWSAQWHVIHEGGDKYGMINRWTGCRLTRVGTGLDCTKSDKVSENSWWRPKNLTNIQFGQEESTPSQVKNIDDRIAAHFYSTDGDYPDEFDLKGITSRSRLGSDFENDIEVINVWGNYTTVIGYENPDFTGRTVTLHCGRYELIGDPENEISSIKVIKAVRPEASCPGVDEGMIEIHNWD
jgi:hypothetical protein